MSTDLAACQVELSKQIGDFWNSTTTSGGSGTTLLDTALKAFPNDWIDATSTQMWDRITSGTYVKEERRITSLANTSGTLTVLAHGGTIASSVTYEVHRLFSASEKRRALIYAARKSFPFLFRYIYDESKILGNWLINGSFESYTTDVANNWTTDTVTAVKNITKPYYKQGSASYKLSTSAGNVSQGTSNTLDLIHLAGKSVTFTLQGWCDTASCLRLQIYDGATTTNSPYHPGDSAFTGDSDPLEVTATIADNPTEITFRILHNVGAGVSYAEDARVIGPARTEVYIGDLGLDSNTPTEVLTAQRVRLRGWSVDEAHFLHIPTYLQNCGLRIIGIGYLDFLKTGASSNDWAATIAIDSPQTDILIAEAAKYLYAQKVMPDEESGESDQYARAVSYWNQELKDRRASYSMETPIPTVHFGV